MTRASQELLSASKAILLSYSALLFSTKAWPGILLFLLSFLIPAAGLAGFVSVLLSLYFSKLAGLNEELRRQGYYSYNALLFGIGLGTFYPVDSLVFWILLVSGTFLTLLTGIFFGNRLHALGLPTLSIPFIFSLWVCILATEQMHVLSMSERNIYWLNEMYAIGGSSLVSLALFFEDNKLPPLLDYYFRALSTVLFQSNVLSGFGIALSLLIFSRIAFLASWSAYLFSALFYRLISGSDELNFYHLGSNFMMSSIAIASFYLIPNKHSFRMSIWSIPVIALFIAASTALFSKWNLPVFSLPFCLTVWLFLFFMKNRVIHGKAILTPYQNFSPEKNLYDYRHATGLSDVIGTFRFQLPFNGKWFVSQGHDGDITHLGDWSKAFDFIVLDEQKKSWQGSGTKADDYYCFAKPVLAPGPGIVSTVSDGIEDNEIGKINQEMNWGNSIVIWHAYGLYSKFSHLKKDSILVKPGEAVVTGQVIALCGSSGRSPEPHLHVQFQSYPYIGSKTISYPFAIYYNYSLNRLQRFSIPFEGEEIGAAETDALMAKAFAFQPGWRATWNVFGKAGVETESWEAHTDAFNRSYLQANSGQAVAYYISNETGLYFQEFYGDKHCALFWFYVFAHRVIPCYYRESPLETSLPGGLFRISVFSWLGDFLAPFRELATPRVTVSSEYRDDVYHPEIIRLRSELFLSKEQKADAACAFELNLNGIYSMEYKLKDSKILKLVCKQSV